MVVSGLWACWTKPSSSSSYASTIVVQRTGPLVGQELLFPGVVVLRLTYPPWPTQGQLVGTTGLLHFAPSARSHVQRPGAGTHQCIVWLAMAGTAPLLSFSTSNPQESAPSGRLRAFSNFLVICWKIAFWNGPREKMLCIGYNTFLLLHLLFCIGICYSIREHILYSTEAAVL